MENTKTLKEIKTEKNLNKLIQLLKNLKEGNQFDIKPSLSTYTVYKSSQNVFELDSTNSGWISTIITAEQLASFMLKRISSNSFNWE